MSTRLMHDDGAANMVASGCGTCGAMAYRPLDTCPLCGAASTLRLHLQWQRPDDVSATRALADLLAVGYVILPVTVSGVL